MLSSMLLLRCSWTWMLTVNASRCLQINSRLILRLIHRLCTIAWEATSATAPPLPSFLTGCSMLVREKAWCTCSSESAALIAATIYSASSSPTAAPSSPQTTKVANKVTAIEVKVTATFTRNLAQTCRAARSLQHSTLDYVLGGCFCGTLQIPFQDQSQVPSLLINHLVNGNFLVKRIFLVNRESIIF